MTPEISYLLLDALQHGACIIDKEYKILFWNACLEQWTGISREEIVGTKITDRFSHLSRPMYTARFESLFSGGPPAIFSSQLHPFFLPLTYPEGKPRIHNTTIVPLVDNNTVEGQLLIILDEVTDLVEHVTFVRRLRREAIEELNLRQELQKDLEKTMELLSIAISAASMGIWNYHSKSGTIALSKEACDILGFEEDAAEWTVGAFETMVIDADREKFSHHLAACRERLSPLFHLQFQMIKKDRSRIWVLAFAKVIPSINPDDPVQVIGVLFDVTERQMMYESLVQTNKKLNLLSNITRHDIKNKLTVILGYIELQMETATDPDEISYLTKEMDAAYAIKRQIEFTRDYQEIGVNAPLWHDLASIIKEILLQLDLSEIKVEYDFLPIKVFADTLLVKVFYNLFDNSIRYAEKMTRITVTYHIEDEVLKITVLDDGTGIAWDQKERIFQKGVGKNTGLGLFLTREILAITGMMIRETGDPGKGARFEITVPAGMWRRD
jgi:signal transduction histidine kinase